MNRSSNVFSCSRCGASSHAPGATACVYCGTHFVSQQQPLPQASYYAPPQQMYGTPPGYGPPPGHGMQPPMNVYGPPQPLPPPTYINVRSGGWGVFFWVRIGIAVAFILISVIVNLVNN